MLPWRRKASRRRFIFWGKLFIFTSFSHLLGLMLLFFVYQGETFVYNVVVNNAILASGASIVYLPFKKTVSANFNTVAMQKKKIVNPIKKATMLAKPKSKKKQKKQIAIKKALEKKKIKKVKIKEKPKKKKTKLQKKDTRPVKKKNVPKKDRPKKKVESKQKIQKNKKVSNAKKSSMVAKKNAVSKKASTNNLVKHGGQELIYIGRHDLEALRVQEVIQREVEMNWRPPVGLSKELACILKVLIDWDGGIKKVSVVKSSSVLIYDISARRSIAKLQLPRSVRGKEINITFKQ